MKEFNVMYNIGKVKYVINTHNGIDTHKDGSKFFGICTFKNKKLFIAKQKELIKQGYVSK